MKYEQELRDLARHAREVAALIVQDGRLANQFQTTVRTEMPTRNPDVELKGIEGQLIAVAAAIETYLQRRVVSGG